LAAVAGRNWCKSRPLAGARRRIAGESSAASGNLALGPEGLGGIDSRGCQSVICCGPGSLRLIWYQIAGPKIGVAIFLMQQ
jgi:hypothetical protein